MLQPDSLDLVRETMEVHGQTVGGRRVGPFFSSNYTQFNMMLKLYPVVVTSIFLVIKTLLLLMNLYYL